MNAFRATDDRFSHALPSDKRPRAVVIGSGFGGLAAAIRLSCKGYAVSVYEKLDAPGGRAYVHHQDGFTFDAGPTIITAPFLLEELWALAGILPVGGRSAAEIVHRLAVRAEDGAGPRLTGQSP